MAGPVAPEVNPRPEPTESRRFVRRGRITWRGPFVATLCWLSTAVNATPYAFESGKFLAEAGAWAAWTEMLSRHGVQFDDLQACIEDKAACSWRTKSLHVILARGEALPREKQVRLVNRYVNRKRYNEDRRKIVRNENGRLSIPSHWATLLEFLEKGGDCEDFTTAKYLLLRHFGFSAEDMRIVVVYDRSHRSHHAVLAMRLDAETTWVLDTDNRIYRSRRPRGYRYVYAVNEVGIWDHDIRVPRNRR